MDDLRAALKKLDEEYEAWKSSEGWTPDKARYDPRNYVLISYLEWDDELSRFRKRGITVPVEEARATGRSLDDREEK